ncbi:hypothetical protein IGI04_027398 [Brassica rapa subsp. trilocularis]|uniref:Uncharacterized protein n=1 Tax=Brassica rapa subsp. trilocularis TaxID=1813537 RepID=A0ABQ7L1B0_BRACM|nr:hypothetical protein IGI04_027398 [Brassica rapa subsp. trilocularis]
MDSLGLVFLVYKGHDYNSTGYWNELLWAASCSLWRSSTWWAHCYIWTIRVIRRLSPASFHAAVANPCFELKNQLITASYVDDETSM